MKKAITISVFNQKGGSSKSTSTLNIATALTYKAKEIFGKDPSEVKVLVIDNDGQSNSTYITLQKDDDTLIDEDCITINDLMITKEIKAKDVIKPTLFDGVDIIPSTLDHVYTDMQLVSVMDNNRILKKKLKEVENDYDFIIIDNPPAISLTTYNALMAADYVIAPIESSVFSVKGLTNLVNLVEDMNENRTNKLKILTFLTKVDNRKGIKNVRAKKVLKETLGDRFIYANQISLLSIYTNSFESGETAVTCTTGNLKGSEEYVNLTKSIVEIINKDMECV